MGSINSYETSSGKRDRVRYRKPDESQTDKRGFRTKREAELFLAAVEISKARGDYVDASAARPNPRARHDLAQVADTPQAVLSGCDRHCVAAVRRSDVG